MKLDYHQALKRVSHIQGACLMYGDQPLLEQNLLSQFRTTWQSQGFERQRFDLQNSNDWKQVFSALNSLSLFSEKLAIEVHGNLKPDAQGLKQLKSFLLNPQENLLLMVFPKQESQSLKSAFFQSIEANGHLIALHAYGRHEQQRILQHEADLIGLQLSDQAWHWLLDHHENNLLAARNSLLCVADSISNNDPSGQRISIDSTDLAQHLQDQSRFSSFDLGDACLKGDLPHAQKILQFLLESGEAHTLIFWVIQKEMRLLLQLFEQPHNALQLGIWKNKVALYQNALKRFDAPSLVSWTALMLRTDCAIKGFGHENSADLLFELVCTLCGKSLFGTSRAKTS